MTDSQHLIAKLRRGFTRVGTSRDRTGYIDQRTLSILSQPNLQCSLKISALCTNTGDKKPEIGRGEANAREGFRKGRTHYQPYIVIGIPGLRQSRNMEVQ